MDPGAISLQIDRILHSRQLANKGQLKKLLHVLHESMDSQNALNTDLVIRELWPSETKTKRSADVATEMNRLRHALKNYYDEEGADDPITISLPNRAAGADGTRERPWITAEVRDRQEVAAAVAPAPTLQAVLTPSSPATSSISSGTAAAAPALSLPAEHPGKRKRIAVIAVLIVVLGIAAYLYTRALSVHGEPRFGKLEGNALVIMNADGKEIWRKVFPDGLGPDWYYGLERGTRIWFADLEGSGHTSVLFAYSPAGTVSHSSTLICYSDRGKEKWKWTPGRELPEMAGSLPTFLTVTMRVLKATDKRPPRIVVSSIYTPWWPCQIALLDANGKTVSEYWHSGTLDSLILADLDGDNREEIIATGTANGYDHQATLVVLDPDRVSGASREVRPEFQIHGMGLAQERLRLLFPRSDLNRVLFQFNWAAEPTFEQGNLRLTVRECTAPVSSCRIWYEFDKNMHLISAFAGGDEFRSAHNRFFQTGPNAHDLTEQEKAAFQKVRCIVGCPSEFVPIGKILP